MHLDPELAAALATLPDLHLTDLAGARRRRRELADQAPRPELGQVALTQETIPAAGDRPAVPVLLATPPASVPRPTPAVLMLHGGGFVMGDAAMTAAQAVDLCARLGTVVVSVDYRLAPEHPYPAALHDCAAALRWITGQVSTLGVDPDRLGVYGMSAGGGLAAALTLLLRDHGGPRICFQLLAPQLDDRLGTPSMHASVDTPMLNRLDVEISWRHYLSHCADDIPPHAAPARAEDLSGLPPAYISLYEHDPLRDEGLTYAAKLLQAGVAVELHVFPGTFHRSMIITGAEMSRRQTAETTDALQRGLRAQT